MTDYHINGTVLETDAAAGAAARTHARARTHLHRMLLLPASNIYPFASPPKPTALLVVGVASDAATRSPRASNHDDVDDDEDDFGVVAAVLHCTRYQSNEIWFTRTRAYPEMRGRFYKLANAGERTHSAGGCG